MTDIEIYEKLKDRICIEKVIAKHTKQKTANMRGYQADFQQLMRYQLWDICQAMHKKGYTTPKLVDANIRLVTYILNRKSYDIYKELFCEAENKTLNKAMGYTYHNANHKRYITEEEPVPLCGVRQ